MQFLNKNQICFREHRKIYFHLLVRNLTGGGKIAFFNAILKQKSDIL